MSSLCHCNIQLDINGLANIFSRPNEQWMPLGCSPYSPCLIRHWLSLNCLLFFNFRLSGRWLSHCQMMETIVIKNRYRGIRDKLISITLTQGMPNNADADRSHCTLIVARLIVSVCPRSSSRDRVLPSTLALISCSKVHLLGKISVSW